MVDALVVAVFILVNLALYIGGIVATSRRPDRAYRAIGRTKAGTVILVVWGGSIAGAYFLLWIRRRLLTAEAAIPAGSLPPTVAADVTAHP